MDRLAKRRIGDVRRRVEKNKFKFITMYTQNVYFEIYQEAERAYNTINRNNPGTKDLTKTLDFFEKVAPEKPVPHYYHTGRTNRQESRKNNERVMTLNIPLMKKPAISEKLLTKTTAREETAVIQPAPAREEMEVIQTAPEQEEMEAIQTAPEQEEMEAIQTAPEQEEMEVIQTAPEQEETHLIIPDRVYTELLDELKKDPELHKIFNDFNPPQSDDILDAFVGDEISPLEIELSQLGYD